MVVCGFRAMIPVSIVILWKVCWTRELWRAVENLSGMLSTHLLEGLRSISVFITTKIILCAGLVSVFARALFLDFI